MSWIKDLAVAIAKWLLGKIIGSSQELPAQKSPEQKELEDVEVARNAENNIDARLRRHVDELRAPDPFERKD